jgi:spore germination protein KC
MKFNLLQRKRWVIILSVFFLMLTSGCWDAIEIEKRAVVVALAVDQSPLGHKVSIQVPNPRKTVGGGEEGGGGGGGAGAVELFSEEGRTLQEAFMQIENETNYPLFTGHTQILLIGEELAKNGTRDLMEGLRRNQQIRRHLWPVIIQGEAKDALDVQVRLEEIPIDYLRETIETGMFSASPITAMFGTESAFLKMTACSGF